MVAVIAIILIIISSIKFRNKSYIKFDSIQNVLNSASNIKVIDYNNLNFSGETMVPKVNKLYTFEEDDTRRFEDKIILKEALELFHSVTNYDLTVDDITYDDRKHFTLSLEEDKNPEKWMGVYMPKGICDISTMEAATKRSMSNAVVDEFHLLRDGMPQVSYEIDGCDYSVEMAVKYGVEYIKNINIMNYMDDRFEIVPSEVVVESTQYSENTNMANEETFYYWIYFDITIKDVPLNNTGLGLVTKDAFSVATFAIQIDKKDHVGCIRHVGYAGISNAIEYNGKVVTLESALKELSSYLAAEYKYDVTEIGLRYCSLYKGASGNEYHPFWKIVLMEENGNDLVPSFTRAAYIDMITGDIYVFDDWQGQIIGEKKYKE